METKEVKLTHDISHQFKSYYVVWKPMVKDERTEIIGLFKSYYVVWKPIKENNRCDTAISLNRTMQYGNNINLLHLSFQSHV